MPFFFRTLPGGNATKHAVIGVGNPPPGNGVGIDVKTYKTRALIGSQVVGIGLFNAKLAETAEHDWTKAAFAVLCRTKAVKKGLV